MPTKTKDVDADISEFHYRPDVTIEPALDAAKARSIDNDYFKLKQIKDEDVQVVDGQLTVVSKNATALQPKQKPDEYTYSYATFRKEVEALSKLVTSAGSKITGQIIVHDANNSRYYRLRFDGVKVVAEAALLGWPDGTQTPYPSGGGA